jgi:hypothetical protein
MLKRVILGLLAVISVFVLPWWLVFLISLALLFYFDRFYEVIIIAIFADILYGSVHFIGYPYLITLGTIIVFYIVTRFKKNLIAY